MRRLWQQPATWGKLSSRRISGWCRNPGARLRYFPSPPEIGPALRGGLLGDQKRKPPMRGRLASTGPSGGFFRNRFGRNFRCYFRIGGGKFRLSAMRLASHSLEIPQLLRREELEAGEFVVPLPVAASSNEVRKNSWANSSITMLPGGELPGIAASAYSNIF